MQVLPSSIGIGKFIMCSLDSVLLFAGICSPVERLAFFLSGSEQSIASSWLSSLFNVVFCEVCESSLLEIRFCLAQSFKPGIDITTHVCLSEILFLFESMSIDSLLSS